MTERVKNEENANLQLYFRLVLLKNALSSSGYTFSVVITH